MKAPTLQRRRKVYVILFDLRRRLRPSLRGMTHDPVVLLPLKCSRGLTLLEAKSLTQV